MTHIEKVKKVREMTFSPVNKINDALNQANGDVNEAIGILVSEKQADGNEMANRVANACIVYSYVHNNRVGAMMVLSCQTDFAAKNETFLGLAKDLCMHIVSAPEAPEYVSEDDVPPETRGLIYNSSLCIPGFDKKPKTVQDKIVEGKLNAFCQKACLLSQRFVKDETKTVDQIIKEASSTLGEKIEVKRFVKMVAQ